MEIIEQPKVNEDGAQLELTDGSIGKFKDATKLYEAYNNLQAEFTRKCQELANIKKQTEADELGKSNNIAPADDNVTDLGENNSREQKIAKNDDFEDNFAAKLLYFAENHPDALPLLDSIKQEIEDNNELKKLDDGVNIAYRLAQEKQKYSPAELIASPNFVEDFIMTNEEIKNKVIDNYIKSLASNKKTPKLISGENTFSALASKTELSSLADANKIFKKMLEN